MLLEQCIILDIRVEKTTYSKIFFFKFHDRSLFSLIWYSYRYIWATFLVNLGNILVNLDKILSFRAAADIPLHRMIEMAELLRLSLS